VDRVPLVFCAFAEFLGEMYEEIGFFLNFCYVVVCIEHVPKLTIIYMFVLSVSLR